MVTEDPVPGRVPPAALPRPPTRLIGRETDVAALATLLAQGDLQLVTLTGPGGTGKTRLALAVAAAERDRYRDGVVFVDLTPLSDPALVVPTIATAMGVRELAGEPLLQTLCRVLRERRMLLVLDNCEQVVDAAADVAALLAACPRVVMLATSRIPLHIRAEREVTVAPLSLPDPGRLPPLAELERVAAVTLFVERARAARADFALTAENAAAIAAICQRLDGLPLAIELAAARVKVLSPLALLARLEQRLPLLSGGGRDLPRRQRTMRDAIAWSYDLLTPEEQALFRRLAVFVGGFTLEAAEADGSATRGSGLDVLDGLTSLVDKSLLREAVGLAGEPRFGMFETVREFGLERLAASGDEAAVRARHAAYVLALAEETDPHLLMPGQERWLSRVAVDLDNVRAALAWLQQTGETELQLRLATGLRWFWYVHGHYAEGWDWLQSAYAKTPSAPAILRAKALSGLSGLALWRGDLRQAATLAEESLARWQNLGGNVVEEASLLITLGLVAMYRDDYDQAETWQDAARVVCEPTRHPCMAIALQNLGDVSYARGEVAKAKARYEAALDEAHATGFTWVAADVLRCLASLARAAGDLPHSAHLYRESLALAYAHGDAQLKAKTLVGVAALAERWREPERATRLFAGVAAIQEAVGYASYPFEQVETAQGVAAARRQLSDERFATAWAVGRAASADDVAADASTVLAAILDTASPPSAQPSPAETLGLSSREVEV